MNRIAVGKAPLRANRRRNRMPAVTANPERLSGAAVIGLSRVPLSALLDNFAEGKDLGRFLESFPSVSRDECIAALDYLKELAEAGVLAEQVSD